MPANGNETYTLGGFDPKRTGDITGGDTTYRFSNKPSSTYKWSVSGPNMNPDLGPLERFVTFAWAKTAKQAHAFAERHGMRRDGYAVGRLYFHNNERVG
jgi:hypothetical protein